MADKAKDQEIPDIEGAKGEEPEETGLRKLSQDELKAILNAHEQWVESEGQEGKQADLKKANLQEAYLSDLGCEGQSRHDCQHEAARG